MKKFFLWNIAIVFSAFSTLFADPVGSYEELTAGIRTGEHFVLLLDLPQCTGNPRMPIGYFAPSSMMLIPGTETTPERVATSLLQFSDHTGKPAYEYVKFTIYADGKVTVRTTYYDPQTFTPIGTSHTIDCSLGNGLEIQKKEF
ncbi:MAG: hypothetical protein JSR93_11470 [Verrucomicrobia bacterium]|nr:hypothetical protein [Verrucomicrobiota bacterium]